MPAAPDNVVEFRLGQHQQAIEKHDAELDVLRPQVSSNTSDIASLTKSVDGLGTEVRSLRQAIVGAAVTFASSSILAALIATGKL